MISPGDSTALADLLARLSSDRQLLDRMSANALQYFSTCPTWAESAEMVRTYLVRMLESS
jgi:glycosyltransferase involved in cell wall biosynthesis